MTGAPRDLIGALLVDKPSGPTSHDVVAFARRLLKTSRIGHTGTLDPLATGLLVLLVGPATRLARFVSTDDKEYIADVRLGIATPSYDAASLADVGPPTSEVRCPTSVELEAALTRFRGTFLQTPPAYSAKKVGGVAAYEKARKKEAVDLLPVPVTVRELQVLGSSDVGRRTSDVGSRSSDLGPRSSDVGLRDPALVRLRVAASAGFYVRSLAHDLGQALGCGAHLEALRRTRAGRFRVEDAATLDQLQADAAAAAGRVLPVNALLAHLPAVTVTDEGLRRATHGNSLGPPHINGGCPLFRVAGREFVEENSASTGERNDLQAEEGAAPVFRVLDRDGEVVAIADGRTDGLLHPLVVLR